jgi:hypothetical protein
LQLRWHFVSCVVYSFVMGLVLVNPLC